MKTENTMLNFKNVTQQVYIQMAQPERQRIIFELKSEDLGDIQLHCENFRRFICAVSEKITFLSFDQ